VFNPTRDQSRDFLFDVWAKHLAGAPLSALESLALSIVIDIPKYHAVLGDRERYRDRGGAPKTARPTRSCTSPCTSRSRAALDRPAARDPRRGQGSRCRRDSAHDARHDVMECLAEVISERSTTARPSTMRPPRMLPDRLQCT
jgi:hypothetical protein